MSSPGRTVVVTGAASGIGAEVVRRLVADGDRVIELDLSSAADHRGFDVADPEAWTALAAGLAPGPVHGLVSCAGTTWRARVGDVTRADFERVQAVNVLGPLLGTQALVPLMPPGSSIVHVGSIAATQGHYPVAYTASKWSLRGVMHASCLELGPSGIRVNLVHPGFVETPMTAGADPAFRSASIEQTPLGRVGTPLEVAEVVAFLLSERASFVSGAEIPVDGGAASHGGAKGVSDAMRPGYRSPAA